jgi:hypothetical protein
MASSTHKYIIFTSMGCAGALLVVVGLLAVLSLHNPAVSRLMREEPTTLRSADALDSLDAVRAWYRATANAGAAYAFAPRGSTDGAEPVLAVWRDSSQALLIPLGDTFPVDSRQYRTWGRLVDWVMVDSLVAAARRPWRSGWSPIAAADSGRVWRGLLSPVVVVSTTRQVLAAARHEERNGRRARADTLVRAVVTLGRRLQEDVATPHVTLGRRIEYDALGVLARMYGRWNRPAARDSAAAALARADTDLVRWRAALRLIQTAAVLPEHAAAIAKRAEDPTWPLALRGEMVLAIGFAWAYNGLEVTTGPDRRRRAALAELARAPLPVILAKTLRAARAAAAGSLASRFEASTRYRNLAQAEWWVF